MICNACGRPPTKGQKLRNCKNCQCAAYHDAECQRNDWKRHKRVCAKFGKIFVPLYNQVTRRRCETWWTRISEREKSSHQSDWKTGFRLWQRQDYLEAVEYFQQSLDPIQRHWDTFSTSMVDRPADKNTQSSPVVALADNGGDGEDFGRTLAERLLFCASCELDGQAIDSGRQRLAQCLSILTSIQSKSKSDQHDHNKSRPATWDDAWMELVLSMEEVDDQRQFAKNVAALALCASSCSISGNEESRNVGPCGWTDAWQRPGYMAPQLCSRSPMYVARDKHPAWCFELEQQFTAILEEYEQLRRHSKKWSKVGSGDRGSGHDDHRVVVGRDWTEFVLFGTGEPDGTEAKKTRSLIRQLVPDAVSLAQQGGGEIIFSRLAPHTRIQAHCGPTNLRWTAHLGLVVPTLSNDDKRRCQIRVGVDWHSWEPGKILLFDDSFEHEVRNDTDQERVVLLLRLWHPSLPTGARHPSLNKSRQRKDASVEKRYHPPPP